MPTWPAKDPEAVLDYVYRIPLDAADSVSSGTPWLTKLSGDVTIVSQALAAAPDTTSEGYGQDLTVWISGGTDAETAVYKVEWQTAGGRTPDPVIITQAVVAEARLLLTGYMKPSCGHLTARYPAFASVAASTIGYWLTDGERYVTNAWTEGDYAAGLMALAAHNMALAGLGTDAAATADIPSGVSSFKSGSLSVNFTEAAANARATGDYSATRYGQEYYALLRRNRSGPIVAPTGVPPDGVYPGVWP
jgi:hypothetical protein